MITEQSMQNQADKVQDLVSTLQNMIFNRLIDKFNESSIDQVDSSNVLIWQAEQLAKTGQLTNEVIQLLAEFTGKTTKELRQLIIENGEQANAEIREQLTNMTGITPTVSDHHKQLLNGLLDQTYSSFNNVINQSLISRNSRDNVATRVFEDIVNQSTIETISGLKTHEQAITENVLKWVQHGLPTNLTDRTGHNWSLEGYSRMVVNTAAHNTYNKVRMNAMDEFNVTLAVMSAHAAAREACAPIQGRVVNVIPHGDSRYNSKYPTIYDHDYGKASGTQGANCRHTLTPYVEGASSNPYTHPDTDQAIKNGKIQAYQRLLERNIRNDKKMMDYADKLGDTSAVNHYKSLLQRHRSKLRQHISEHDFLHRDYSREKVVTKLGVDYNKAKLSDSQRHVKFQLTSGNWSNEINREKQADHMASTHLSGKSYLFNDEDPQDLINKCAGTGELKLNKSGKFSNVETVKADHEIGIDGKSGEPTSWFKIHHSKGRTHIVPVKINRKG